MRTLTWMILLSVAAAGSTMAETRRMSRAELRDRIEGGWAGQMIGVSFGAPTEFRFNGKLVPLDRLPQWKPEMVSNSLGQDDLYVDMTFAKVLDDKGVHATTDDFGAMFREAKYRLWHANLAARRALKRGVSAELSGTPKYNAHANDIDFQIEADFIGLMAPGLPQWGNEMALRAGRVMNTGDGIIGGMFMSAMYSAAFFESDPRRVVEAGLASMPPASPYAKVIRDVLQWSKQYPDDWEKVWAMVNEKWDKREPCPEGALLPFNIDAKINGAYVALGLLYGKGDFGKTVEIATRGGQDSDCNPASAGGILGVMLGYRRIPDAWKSGIPAISDKKFSYTDFTYPEIVASTEKRALALIEATGGKVGADAVEIAVQKPKPLPVPLWDDYGAPVERVKTSDCAVGMEGRVEDLGGGGPSGANRVRRGQRSCRFRLRGRARLSPGRICRRAARPPFIWTANADRTVDVVSDEAQNRGGEAVWHLFGLKKGKHTVRLVVDGKPGPGSDATDVAIEGLIVFR